MYIHVNGDFCSVCPLGTRLCPCCHAKHIANIHQAEWIKERTRWVCLVGVWSGRWVGVPSGGVVREGMQGSPQSGGLKCSKGDAVLQSTSQMDD